VTCSIWDGHNRDPWDSGGFVTRSIWEMGPGTRGTGSNVSAPVIDNTTRGVVRLALTTMSHTASGYLLVLVHSCLSVD